jgi:hypothetical protein
MIVDHSDPMPGIDGRHFHGYAPGEIYFELFIELIY